MSSRADRIHALLQVLKPARLDIVNDSARHHGHAGDDGSGETHFTVIIGADVLNGLSRVEQQRRVMDLLADEFKSGLHALNIQVIRG